MAEVSVYTAVISAAAAIVGTMIPLTFAAVQEARRAERDRQERLERERRRAGEERRLACVRLLRTVHDLRVHVANSHESHGIEMAARLAEIRQYVANAKVEAAGIQLMQQAPPDLGGTAERLAQAADRLAEAAAANARLPPDFRELDDCVGTFKALAITSSRG